LDKEFIVNMRKAGKLAARTLEHVCSYAKEGITTDELDKIAHDFTLSNGGKNACLGYKGYPKTICTSVNEVLCHGVPDDRKLVSGDIVNIDVTVKINGYHGDTSRTVGIGIISSEAAAIISAAKGARDAGISAVRPYCKTGDIGWTTHSWLTMNYPDFDIMQMLGGHGIGKIFHDHPHVPGHGMFGTGDLIQPWKCITVEPLVWQAKNYRELPITPIFGASICGITTVVADSGLAAQFEHTVLVTDSGHEILTEG
jgi:methionyl aminopeptidase